MRFKHLICGNNGLFNNLKWIPRVINWGLARRHGVIETFTHVNGH